MFGLSVLYLMVLVFCLFQNHKTVKQIIYWFDPALENFHIDMDRVSKLGSVLNKNCIQLIGFEVVLQKLKILNFLGSLSGLQILT